VPPVNDPNLGTILDGRYELLSLIAEGGMGRVYKAVQRSLDRIVAVKLLKHAEDAEGFQRRFFLEASLCSRLNHPNTIRIFDYGCHQDEIYYIVMEFLEGRPLSHHLEIGGPFSMGRTLKVGRQVCLALAEAHEAGLVHRDLKPANLFSISDGLGGESIKVLDFGVVKQVGPGPGVSQVPSVIGSPAYMSPEQSQGLAIDNRSDLYSLGVVVFELLTGRPPYSGTSPFAVLAKHISAPIPRMTEANPSVVVDAVLEEIVQRAMQKDPAQRFSDAQQMHAAFSSIQTPAEKESSQALPPIVTGSVSVTDRTMIPVELSRTERPSASGDPLNSQRSSVQLFGPLEEGYRAYIDLNCPYCYVMFERLSRWGLSEQIEWCMVEHDGHVLDDAFDLHQEEMLSSEVFEVHHRAPDIQLNLPPARCRSTLATRLLAVTHRLFPEKEAAVRRAAFLALWQDGRDIGDSQVLESLLRAQGLPPELLSMCDEVPEELKEWQDAWEQGDYDSSIPILTHQPSGRVLIGLADQVALANFLRGERRRVIDRTVCFYQQRPSILLCGWMSHLWTLLQHVKDQVEVIQAPTARRASELLGERAVPALLIIEDGHTTKEELEGLALLARSRAVRWLVAAPSPDPDREVEALSAGAIEYLAVDDRDPRIARARLQRLLDDRFRFATESRLAPMDTLTRLPTRRVFLERLEDEWRRAQDRGESISLILLNLDGFKAYNKMHGYLSGDSVLADLASRFQQTVSGSGRYLARFSGNEFSVLLPRTTRQDAEELASSMVTLVDHALVKNRVEGAGHWLSASVGVHAVVPEGDSGFYELVDEADRNLRKSRSLHPWPEGRSPGRE
jgi:diguanylate cyclase (GGDEF)-like protein